MAKKDIEMTNDPFETSSGSLLKAGLAASPFAAGIGIGAHRLLKDGMEQPRASAVEDALNTIRAIKGSPPRPAYLDHLQFINRAHESGRFKASGARQAQEAWTQAMNSMDPYSIKKLPKIASRLGALPENQFLSGLREMGENQSDLSSRLFNKFWRNFDVLSEQPGGFSPFTTIKNLPFEMDQRFAGRRLPRGLSSRLTEIADQGMFTKQFYTRPEFQKHGLGMFNIETTIGGMDVKFNLPISQKGVLMEGATQATKRIAPDVGIIDPMTRQLNYLSREEYFLEELGKSIAPDIRSGRLRTEGEVRGAISGLYEKSFSQLEYTPGLPPDMRTASMQQYEKIRGQAVDVMMPVTDRRTSGTKFSPAYRQATQEELAEAMSRYGLMGGTGGKALAQGRALKSTTDLSQRALIPEAVAWSRRPESAIRQFELTEESARQMSQGRFGRYQGYQPVEGPLLAPNLKAMYIDPERHREIMSTRMFMGEGEAAARAGLSDMISHRYVEAKHLKSIRGENVEDFLMKAQTGAFRPGDVLGFTSEGEAIKMQENMRILRAATNRTQGRGDFITLQYELERRLRSNEKFFGDFKGLMKLMHEDRFSRTARRLTANEQMLANLDIIISMDELRKDPSKFSKQVMTSIAESSAARGAPMDIRAMAAQLRELSMVRGDFHTGAFTGEAMRMALQQGLTAQEFGAAFGAAPSVLGSTEAERLANIALSEAGVSYAGTYKAAMSEGVAGGIAQIAYGGPEELRIGGYGTGGMGSVEPRMLNILRGSAFTSAQGEALARELQERLIATDPSKLATSQELTKTLTSMSGGAAPTGANIFDIATEATSPGRMMGEFERFVERGGGYMRMGKDLPDVYVPGPETARTMREFRTAAGVTMPGPLVDTYKKMVQAGALMYSAKNPLGPSDIRGRLSEIIGEIQEQAAPAGQGAGAFQRGRVLGSRYLTGVSEAGGFRPESAFEVGVPRRQAESMFTEMTRSGLYDAAQVKQMQQRFMQGEGVGGLLARHPFIGEYSMQPVVFKPTKARAPQVVIPEITVAGRVQGIDKAHTLRLGPLVGLAGDKDADIFSTMLVSPDNEKMVRQMTTEANSDFVRNYTQHQVRYQLLKPAAAAEENITTIQKMIGESRNLATTQEYVPRLSVAMSEAKAAIGQYAGGSQAAEAAGLLEWLEQTPLQAKHMGPAQAARGELGALMDDISMAMQQKDAVALEEVVNTITKGNKVAEGLLKGGVTLEADTAEAIGRAMGGIHIERNLEGINLSRATHTIMDSLGRARASGASRQNQLYAARGARITMEELPEFTAKMSAVFEAPGRGFSNMAKMSQALANFKGAAGDIMTKFHKPVGIGFAAMLGIGAILSSPDDIVGPGAGMIPQGNITSRPRKGAKRMQGENLHPTGQPMGQPTAPNMMRMNTASISPRGTSRNVNVNLHAGPGAQPLDNLEAIKALAGNTHHVNVNLSDRRSSMNPHVMANRMY